MRIGFVAKGAIAPAHHYGIEKLVNVPYSLDIAALLFLTRVFETRGAI
jgi:hypothetical protein